MSSIPGQLPKLTVPKMFFCLFVCFQRINVQIVLNSLTLAYLKMISSCFIYLIYLVNGLYFKIRVCNFYLKNNISLGTLNYFSYTLNVK